MKYFNAEIVKVIGLKIRTECVQNTQWYIIDYNQAVHSAFSHILNTQTQ